ncbi:MAG: sigma-70 family RNA polymerase sigma factor [Spirochaetales bacterium]|nr:sigma-70 family RNA polymerase sigma factor [Spirochaetales bacterium]
MVVYSSMAMRNDDDDATIVALVLGGDVEAFRVLVERYSDRVFGFCRARLGDDSDAEDAVQDVFIRAFRSLGAFDAGRSFVSWLFSIAANRVKSRYAVRSSAATMVQRAGMEAAIAGEAASLAANPEQLALDRLSAEELRRAVAGLQPSYRAPVELFYFAGLSVADTASALGLGEEAVKTRLFRARHLLARKIAEEEQPAERSAGIP